MFEAFPLTLNPWLPVGVFSSTFLLIPESQLPPATRLPVPNPARIELLGWTGITSLIITQTESRILSRKTHRRCDLFLPSRTNLRVWFHSGASVVCIIDTTGRRLLKKSLRG